MCDRPDFQDHLARQLRFLERSARDFDSGQSDEAYRIATALRVIFRQTRKSTSLLTHLGASEVLIRSTVPDTTSMFPDMPPPEELEMFFISLCTPTLSDTLRLLPKAVEQESDRMIPAPQWWDETFAVINGAKYTRRGLVLCACENDGGAHVDAELPPEYAAIKASGALGWFHHGGGMSPIEDAHLVFLRSMAFEVLHSPELRKLSV